MQTPASLAQAFAPADRTLPRMLQHQAARFGERALFVAGPVRWTFADALRTAGAYGFTITFRAVRASMSA